MNDFSPPPDMTAGPLWHYALDGERIGPVSKRVINGLIAQEKITRETMVWTTGFPEWKEAHSTEFGRHFKDAPPALTGDAISNTQVWVLALIPLVVAMIQLGMLRSAEEEQRPAPNFAGIILLNFAANTLFCWLDSSALKKAGHDTKKFKGWLWLVPVYLYVRSTQLKQSRAPFIVWMVLFILTLGI